MKKLLIQILITCFFAVGVFAKSNIKVTGINPNMEAPMGVKDKTMYVVCDIFGGTPDAIWQVLKGKKWEDLPRDETRNDDYGSFFASYYPVQTEIYPNGGKFRCIIWDIENPKDKIIKTINLKVIKKHILVQSFYNYKSFTAVKGIDQRLEVQGVATGPIHCSWKKITGKSYEYIDGSEANFTPEYTSYFTFNLPLDPKKTYKNEKFVCEIWYEGTNGKNREYVAWPITVNTKAKPEITKNEKATKAEAFDGEDPSVKLQDAMATFSVNVKNSVGKPEYIWHRNGQEIPNAKSNTYKTDRLIDANGDFNDEYEVEILFHDIQVASYYGYTQPYIEYISFGKIQKLEPAKVESISPKGQVAAEGEDITISVNTTKESGTKLKYAWQVCAASADENNPKRWKNTGKNSSELIIKKVSANMNGNKYRCKVSNAGNTKNPSISEISIIEVQAPAAIKKLSLPKTMIEGTKSPKIAVELSKGRNVKYSYFYQEKNGAWQILAKDTAESQMKLESLPFGTFTIKCVAQSYDDNGNPFGKPVEKTGKVTIREKVSIVELSASQTENCLEQGTHSIDYEAFFGYKLTLSVKANGYSPKYQWQQWKNGAGWEPIKGATKKDYCPSMKEKDWEDCLVDEDGVPYKYFRCIVVNVADRVYGDDDGREKIFTVYAITPEMSDSFTGKCFSIPNTTRKLGGYMGAGVIVKNSKEMVIFGQFSESEENPEYFNLVNCTYTKKRTSKKTADITIKATKVYKDATSEKVTYKGTLECIDDEEVTDDGRFYNYSHKLTLACPYGETLIIPLQENTPKDYDHFEEIVEIGQPIFLEEDESAERSIIFNGKKHCTYRMKEGLLDGTYTTKSLGNGVFSVSMKFKASNQFPTINVNECFIYRDENDGLFFYAHPYYTYKSKKYYVQELVYEEIEGVE